ncbi:MAG: FAD-dependent oxidoreductase [Sulfitobacter sp.]
MKLNVLIVGAGPTGLTAAVELARRGIIATVIDKHDGPSHLSRAVGILKRSLDILEPSGVAADIRAEAIAISGIAFHIGAARCATFPLNFDEDSCLLGLPQDRTEHFLAQAFERYGGTVNYGQTFDGLTQDARGVTATINGKTQHFDKVIGADGAHSAVRHALGLDFPGFDLPSQWSIADVDSDRWRDPSVFQGFLLPQGNVCIVVPLEKTRFRVIASQPDALAALPVPMDIRNIRRSGAFTISVRQVERYAVGNVYLAGDAAHCHSPVGGRGMNLGIADAADLAKRIVEGDVEGYHAARHTEGQRIIRFSERGRRIFQSRNPFTRAAVPHVMRAVSKIKPLSQAIIRNAVSG